MTTAKATAILEVLDDVFPGEANNEETATKIADNWKSISGLAKSNKEDAYNEVFNILYVAKGERYEELEEASKKVVKLI